MILLACMFAIICFCYSLAVTNPPLFPLTLPTRIVSFYSHTCYLWWMLTAHKFWQGNRFLEQGTARWAISLPFSLPAASQACCSAMQPLHRGGRPGGRRASRIFATIERQSPIDAMADSGSTIQNLSGSIEFSGVKLVYPSRPNQLILEDFTLSVPAGKTIAVVGPSGSGKTTLFSLLERFYPPLRGAIRLDGQPIDNLNISWLRSQIGHVAQDNFLFDASVQENIAYGLGPDYFKVW